MRNNDRKLKKEPRDNQQRPMHAQNFEQRQNIILLLKISSLQMDGNIFYLWTEIDDVSLTLCRKISPPLTNDPLYPRWNIMATRRSNFFTNQPSGKITNPCRIHFMAERWM